VATISAASPTIARIIKIFQIELKTSRLDLNEGPREVPRVPLNLVNRQLIGNGAREQLVLPLCVIKWAGWYKCMSYAAHSSGCTIHV
jgi:hypothetical protein